MKTEIRQKNTGNVIVSGDYENIGECVENNRANLGGAYLEGATGYLNSHNIFQEAIKRQLSSVFNDAEWSTIAQIIIYRLCWDTIEQRFSNVVPHIFEVLANSGFTAWLEYWNKIKRRSKC